jgi:hypothetical protein
MALLRIRDLEQSYKSRDGNVYEWKAPSRWLYRYERDRGAVGMQTGPDTHEFIWHVLDKNDLSHAKRKVFELINEDEL